MFGVNFTISADGSKAVGGINAVQSAFNQLTNTVKGEVADKLKTVFTAAAIEEAARRTGEWALELDQAAKKLGITNEAYQTLEILARKSALPESDVVGMFENIDKARQDALAGNKELIVSFQRLGVTLQDLQTKTKSELFGLVMGGIPNNVIGSDNLTRHSIQDVTNTPENIVEGVKGALGGQSFAGTIASEKAQGNVISGEDVTSIAATWSNILQDLKGIGITLAPIAKLLLGLFDTVVNALGGIIGFIKGLFDIVVGILSGDTNQITNGAKAVGGIVVGLVFSLGKLITGLIDLIAKGIVGLAESITKGLAAIPAIGKVFKGADKVLDDMRKGIDLTGGLDKFEKSYKDFYGAKNLKQGEAVGDVATAVLTGGESAVGKTIASTALKGAALADKVGFAGASEKLFNAGLKMEKVGRGEAGLFTDKPFLQSFLPKLPAPITKIFGSIASLGALGKAGTQTGITQGTTSKETTPILPLNSLMAGINAGGTSTLKLGGLFGSGFESKIIRLNTEMVRLLSQISTNTQAGRGQGYNTPSGVNGIGQSGGM